MLAWPPDYVRPPSPGVARHLLDRYEDLWRERVESASVSASSRSGDSSALVSVMSRADA